MAYHGCLLIQQVIFTLSGYNIQLIFRHLIMEHPCLHTGSIDNYLCFILPLVGLQLPAIFGFGDFLHLRVELKPDSIHCGILRQREIQTKGADNGTGRRPKGSNRLFGYIGFHFLQTGTVNDLQAFHTVGYTLFVECLKAGFVFLSHAQNQTAAAVIMEIQILRQLFHHFATLDIEFRHQRTIGRIIACMDNCGIRLCGTAANILFLFQNQNIRLIAAQFPGTGTAGNTRADNDDI